MSTKNPCSCLSCLEQGSDGPDILRSLSQEEYDALEAPSEEDIKKALDEGYQDAFGRRHP